MIKKEMLLAAVLLLSPYLCRAQELEFDPSAGYTVETMTFQDGSSVRYRAYEGLVYVTRAEDAAYQSLNIYVPECALKASKGTPILLKNNIEGYMAVPPRAPRATDAGGRALLEGYVVCIPGARGPRALLDLKAAVRYLRYNDSVIPGDSELIFSDGTDTGGAVSSLLGATGNHPVFEPYLREMGAAAARDDIYACIAYCPMMDLDQADMTCIDALGLTDPSDGESITSDNMRDYIKKWLIKSMQRARDEGAVIPEEAGAAFYQKKRADDGPQGERPPGGPGGAGMGGPGPRQMVKEQGNIVIDIDMDKYLSYVVSTGMLKTPHSSDASSVSPERTSWDIYIYDPLDYIGNPQSATAHHWFIRHGARDLETGFNTPVTLAARLMDCGFDVDFFLPWNRAHSGDYNLDDLFAWIKAKLHK